MAGIKRKMILEKWIKPQKGPQELFLSTPADVCIYGGAAGGGKSWSILYEPLRHVDTPGFNAVIFRRTMPQIMNTGSIWEASGSIYRDYPGAQSLKTPRPRWIFPSGAVVSFAHMEMEDTKYDWQGTEICLIEFDELTHFTEGQFFYMLSRNRSTCGIRPYVRATCNPDPDSFVARLISWWIDPDTGYAIPERSGVLRYFARLDNEILWGDTRQDVLEQGADADDIVSFTFIASSLFDNKILLEKNPTYLSNLKAMGLVDRERLLNGNWKIRPAAGLMFKRTKVNLLQDLPTDVVFWARGWDLAATSEDEDGEPAYTAGVLIGKRKNGRYVVADVINRRSSSAEVRELIKMTCGADRAKYGRVITRRPQDPGQAGKGQAQSFLNFLSGFPVKILSESGDKVTRAEPFSAQWLGLEGMDKGNVDVLAAPWNEMYFNQLESFPQSKFKDMVDASSSAFHEIENGGTYSAPPAKSRLGKSSYWK